MILTYKLRHGRDFSEELRKARAVAEFAVKTRSRTSADVKHLGLKSVISNQILRKYSRNKKCRGVRNVMMTVPSQGVKLDRESRIIEIPALKLQLQYIFNDRFEKINQIELDAEYAYVSVSVSEPEQYAPNGFIGVDRNTTGHCAVVANPTTGKVWKFGKNAHHVHEKYKNMRRALQEKRKFKRLRKIKNREARIVRDTNHKISRAIVNIAKESECGIKMEKLGGIRQTAKSARSFRYSLNSWSFYQLEQFIDYKAKLLGVPVVYVAPQYTSQECSRCGLIGSRNGKSFKCPSCGHVEHADVNASFNIALRPPLVESVVQSRAERDVREGNSDVPLEALP